MQDLLAVTLSVALAGVAFLAYLRITRIRDIQMSYRDKVRALRRTLMAASVVELGIVLVLIVAF